PVARVAVGMIGRLAKHTHAAGLFHPAQQAIVGDVAPHQEAPIPKPARALGPQRPSVQALDWRVPQAVGPETCIEDFDGGIRVPDRGRPAPISGVRRHVSVSSLLALWIETGVILKGAYRWINLLVETAHALLDIGVDAVAQLAGALLLRLIGLTVQGAAILQFPDAQILQYSFSFLQLEAPRTDVAGDLQAFRQVLLVIPAVKVSLMLRGYVHHHHEDGAADVLRGISLIRCCHAVPSVSEYLGDYSTVPT